jgi:hypothetical protein
MGARRNIIKISGSAHGLVILSMSEEPAIINKPKLTAFHHPKEDPLKPT